MANERFKAFSAVGLMLMRENNGKEEILLQKRQNTGYADGCYDFSATGHVEAFESMTKALIREAKEEIDIDIKAEEIEFVCLIHRISEDVYYNGYFKVTKWEGKPRINEPEKNEEIKWFAIDDMPENLVPDRKLAMENYKKGIKYNEFGG